jgi:hypothetical protein
MIPSQRTALAALAVGAAGFVVTFALGPAWFVAAGLGVALGISTWLTLNYFAPTDVQGELEDNLRRIDQVTGRIRAASHRVSDRETASALQAGCDGVPRMIDIIRGRDARVGLPLSARTLAYLSDVSDALADYVEVQDTGDPEYLRVGRRELQRLEAFTAQPDRELSEQKMDDYISSLTALNLNPPPELT